MITLKTEKGKHIVSVNGEKHSFEKFRYALDFIFVTCINLHNKENNDDRRS